MQNSEEIFRIALGLQAHWQIKSINFDSSIKILDIEIGCKRGRKFKMSDGNFYSAYDTVKRRWEHLNFFQHKCFISYKVPRVKQLDGKLITQEVTSTRKGIGSTLLF